MKKIQIHFANVNKVDCDELLLSPLLTNFDHTSIEQYHHPEAKKEKIVSTFLIRKYVGDYSVNEFSKPIAEHICFNASHSHGAVVLVLDEVPVGIDIEKIRPADNQLVDYISSKEEKEYIKDDKTFFEIWTNKESLVKAVGTGIRSKVNEIVGLPINGIRKWNGQYYRSLTTVYQGFVITVTRMSEEPFDVYIEEGI